MFFYNITIKIDHAAHQDWQGWMTETYIPEVLDTGLVRRYTLSRLLGLDETDGFTYSLQLLMPDFAAYQVFQAEHATRLFQLQQSRFGQQFVTFSTVMRVVEAGRPQREE